MNVHEIKESFPLKPSLGLFHEFIVELKLHKIVAQLEMAKNINFQNAKLFCHLIWNHFFGILIPS